MNKNRRINRELFDCLLKLGKNLNSDKLYIKYFTNKDFLEEKSRFSFIISSKISKNAVERNLFKRRGRSIVRNLDKSLNNGFLCAFFAKDGVNKLEYSKLEEEIVSLLTKSGILKN